METEGKNGASARIRLATKRGEGSHQWYFQLERVLSPSFLDGEKQLTVFPFMLISFKVLRSVLKKPLILFLSQLTSHQ